MLWPVKRSGPTLNAAFDSGGALVAVGYTDGAVGVFDGHTGKFENVIRTGLSAVNGVSFVPGSSFLITRLANGTVAVWNPLDWSSSGVIDVWRVWWSRRSQQAWISIERMKRLLEHYPLPAPRLRISPVT